MCRAPSHRVCYHTTGGIDLYRARLLRASSKKDGDAVAGSEIDPSMIQAAHRRISSIVCVYL
jgi:hypothetical protein